MEYTCLENLDDIGMCDVSAGLEFFLTRDADFV